MKCFGKNTLAVLICLLTILPCTSYSMDSGSNEICDIYSKIKFQKSGDFDHYYTNEDLDVRSYLIEADRLMRTDTDSECIDFKLIAEIATSGTGWICLDSDGTGLSYDECNKRLILSDLVNLYILNHHSKELILKYIEFLNDNKRSSSEYMSIISEDIFIHNPNIFLEVLEELTGEDRDGLIGALHWGMMNNHHDSFYKDCDGETILETMKDIYGESIDYKKFPSIFSSLFYYLDVDGECPVMNILNDRSNPARQKQVVEELYRNRDLYKHILLDYITKKRIWNDEEMILTQDIPLEVIIMIAGLSGDHEYVEPLINLMQSDSYVSNCIYSCAITFALSVLSDEDDIEKIKNIRKFGIVADGVTHDVISSWENFKYSKPESFEQRKEEAKANMVIANDEFQVKYQKLLELDQYELLKLIGSDYHSGYHDLLLPLTVLEYFADDEQTIIELLKLMLTVNPNYYDGSDEIRGAIISATKNYLIQHKKLEN